MIEFLKSLFVALCFFSISLIAVHLLVALLVYLLTGDLYVPETFDTLLLPS
jgi:hypothetical protein